MYHLDVASGPFSVPLMWYPTILKHWRLYSSTRRDLSIRLLYYCKWNNTSRLILHWCNLNYTAWTPPWWIPRIQPTEITVKMVSHSSSGLDFIGGVHGYSNESEWV